MTPLGLFGLEPAGNGPTYLVACGPAAELTLVLLWATKMISLCPSKDLEMLIHEKRYEKCERTHIKRRKYFFFIFMHATHCQVVLTK